MLLCLKEGHLKWDSLGEFLALANGANAELAAKFAPIAQTLNENETKIIEELLSVEGKAQDIGGYFHPNDEKAEAAMRPSATLNAIIDAI